MLVSRGKALYHLFPKKLAVPLSETHPLAHQNLNAQNANNTNDFNSQEQIGNMTVEFKVPTCVTDRSTIAKPIHVYQILQQISEQYCLDILLNDVKCINGLRAHESPLILDKIGTHNLLVDLFDQQVDIIVTIVGE
ncbi:hypothetical protein BmR1_04g09810 [Babesia microti strain RI]|uniref:Uncharacterized protein n=1 Tax=Babesia microti (strain RI) TaxID=1133968 RepID=I7IA49_BABMR|nr:hypothetical protein BmR1_04g09810 [Babesia microti strain RI]CCF76129.1 hypothetical protein BmR1_04g09810 [Babesia microti strain RI]|eukprot:XP_012650537.1 hypothetical protein BmR1_04g09810 [Babesia microti strain RI]